MNCSENVLLFQTLLGLSWFPSLSGYLGRYGRDPLVSLPALSALDLVLFKFLGLPDPKGQIRGRGGNPNSLNLSKRSTVGSGGVDQIGV